MVESRIRELIKGFCLSSDFIPFLNVKVASLIEESKRRAEENGRKTLQAKDL